MFLVFYIFALIVTVTSTDSGVTNGFIDYNSCDFPSSTPQRVDWLDEILINTHRILHKYEITSWAVASTLLGIIRDKRTMPWTWDVDIAAFGYDISTICSNSSKPNQELKDLGYRVYNCQSDFARICKANRTYGRPKYIITGEPIEARLDIYGMTPIISKNTKMTNTKTKDLWSMSYSNCQWNMTGLFPLRNYSWGNNTKSIHIPNNYNYWLQMGYGSNWTVVDKYGGGRDNICTYNSSYNI